MGKRFCGMWSKLCSSYEKEWGANKPILLPRFGCGIFKLFSNLIVEQFHAPFLFITFIYTGQFSDNCNATWKLVYEHSEDGTALQGDVQTLQSAVLAGARVRVLTTKDGDVQASEADGLYEKDGHVYAELQEVLRLRRNILINSFVCACVGETS